MPRRLALALALLATLLPLALPTLTVRAQPSPVRFESAPCMFDLPRRAQEGRDVVCGYVVVPEFHANSTGPTIKLAVAVFKSRTSPAATDATIYLTGGPGGRVNNRVRNFAGEFGERYIENRDFIIFDQRGAGRSQPALSCPETATQGYMDDAARVSYNEYVQNGVTALLRCRDRLVAAGVNLGAYTTAENAADVNDIRAALGYGTLNLIGVSYGTRLALTVMRDFPRAVRSAVLDSTVPLEASRIEDVPQDYDALLKRLFASCASQQACADRFPTLASDFAEAYVRLNANPVSQTLVDRSTDQSYIELLRGDDLAGFIRNLLYAEDGAVQTLRFIAELKRGNYQFPDVPERVDINPAASENGSGVYWSVFCSDEVPFNNYDRALANAQSVQFELREWAVQYVKQNYAICAKWGVPPAPRVETAPVRSNIPTVVITSASDHVTPPRYGQAVAQTLSRSYLVEFPPVGHAALFASGNCGFTIVLDFINTPTRRPGTSCVRNL